MPRILDQDIETNPFDTASTLMGQSADLYRQAGQNTPTAAQSMNAYLNPYYDQVIADTMSNMERQGQIGMNNIGDEALAAGAFGSGRHGIREAVYGSELNRNMGQMANQMRMEQFNTAAGLGAQDASRNLQGMLAGAGGLAGMGQQYYNVGTDITNRQMQSGNQQQSLMQAILDRASGQFDAYSQSPTNALQIMMAALNADPRRGNTYNYGYATGENTQPGPSGIGQALGLGLQIAGLPVAGGGSIGGNLLGGLLGG